MRDQFRGCRTKVADWKEQEFICEVYATLRTEDNLHELQETSIILQKHYSVTSDGEDFIY